MHFRTNSGNRGSLLMSLIFDTHAHYDDSAFDNDREELLSKLPSEDVFAVINAGADIESSHKSIEFSEKYDYIYAAVGIHPENMDKIAHENFVDELEKLILNNKKVVAVGEIGLDYYYNSENKDAQKSVFEIQIKIALRHNLPTIIHDREAHNDILTILKKYKPKGVIHCFSGNLEMAEEVINLGMHIGIGGIVTFKNTKNILEIVKNISLSSIVLETDAPYLAPAPFRGKRCNSAQIKYTAEKIAEIKGIETSEVLKVTQKNAVKLFGVFTK